MRGRTEEGENLKPHSIHTLIDAAGEPEVFGRVMAGWLERDATWDLARTRFFAGWNNQRLYDPDRIVGAANVFEVLPREGMPPENSLPNDVAKIIEECKDLVKTLPESNEKHRMFMCFGQASSPTLKEKIRHRSSLITAVMGKALPEIDYVTDAAVDLRNYFVHGRESDPRRNLTKSGIFLTNTLEFVFCASDLIESGWDIRSWLEKNGHSHPLGWYLMNYQDNLLELKRHYPKGATRK